MSEVKAIVPKTLVVNLYSGPNGGKSTAMSGVYNKLKKLDVNCEMGHEFAKEKIWDESYAVLRDQIYVFAKQLHSLRRLDGKVTVVVTDSPLLLSLVYGKGEPPSFSSMVIEVNKQFRSLDFFLRRPNNFNQSGRIHNLEQSKEIDNQIMMVLNEQSVQYEAIDADELAEDVIVKKIMNELENSGEA